MNKQNIVLQSRRPRIKLPFQKRYLFGIPAIILLLSIIPVWILSYGRIISPDWANIFTIICTPLGVVLALCQWLLPVSTTEPFPPSPISSLPEPPISKPSSETSVPSAWNVPYRRNPFFTGREELLRQLHEKLIATTTATLTQTQAISGLGGIGKTQIALEYAHAHRNEYQYVFWASAVNQETLFNNMVEIAHLLTLPEQNDPDQNMVVEAVKQWLATHTRWLLILDNADELVLIDDFLPVETKGHLLLTTRDQTVGTIASLFEVPKMTRNEGVLLLLRRAGRLTRDASLNQAKAQDQMDAEIIVEELDKLPLAIDQAGAYIEETKCTLSSYLKSYRNNHQEMLQKRGPLPSNHPEPVATTWSLSFQNIKRANPIAADILYLCAFLDADAIPEEIFTGDAIDLGPHLKHIHTNSVVLDEAIGILRKYSLIHRNSDEKNITIHRLVQAILKDTMQKKIRLVWAERAINAINAVFPKVDVDTWEQCRRYLPQAQTCLALIYDYSVTSKTTEALMRKIATYDKDHALYPEAETICKNLAELYKKTRGPEHPDTATCLNNLAFLYNNQGKYEQAEPLYQRVLAIREKVLGPEHPDTAQSLNNLAVLYKNQGKYEQAEPLYQRALAICEKVLGLEHPDTATCLNNLAFLYKSQGKYEQAEPLYQRALAICEKVLGPEHPDTASSLNNLAALYGSQGKHEQAEPLYQRALKIKRRNVSP